MKTFHRTQHNDGIKAAFCRDNNIPLLCIPYWDFDRIDELVRTFVATLGAIEPMPQPTPTTPRKSARQRKQLRLSTDTW